jgi:ABC-2 type transport system permease protein
MWARNLGNLMMSPLTPIGISDRLMVMSLIRLAGSASFTSMTLLAMIFFDLTFTASGCRWSPSLLHLIFTSWSLGIFVSGLVCCAMAWAPRVLCGR